MRLINWPEFKFAAGVGMALSLAGGAAALAVAQAGGNEPWTARQIVQQSREAYAVLYNYTDRGTVVAESNGVNTKTEFATFLQRPDSYSVQWIQTTDGRYTSRGRIWSAGCENLAVLATAGQRATYSPRKEPDRGSALARGARASGMATSSIPALFFQDHGDPAAWTREADERIGNVDCYVVSSISNSAAGMVWIGRRDLLVHQIRTSAAGASVLTETHEDIALDQENLSGYFAR